MNPVPIVTLLTDFGQADGTVAEMKGRLLALAPELQIVDVSHAIPPQDVRAGAFLLARTARSFARGVVHVAVVDPGVGTERRAVAALSHDGHWFVGPDNGLLGAALGVCERCVVLDAARVGAGASPSPTFHGRDLFAPAAALIARGDDPLGLGEVGPPPIVLPASWQRQASEVVGEVVWIDHFGNAITEIPAAAVSARGASFELACGRARLHRIVRTYADVAPGEALAYVGSAGTLEFAQRDGHFARGFEVERGSRVIVRGIDPSGARS